MISEVREDVLRLFAPGSGSVIYTWRNWSDLVEDIVNDIELRAQLLAVPPACSGTAFEEAQDFARVVNASIAANEALGPPL